MLLSDPARHVPNHLRCERLLRRRALPRQHAHGDDREYGGDHGDRPGRGPAHEAAVEERQHDQEDERDGRHADRAEEDRLRPLEDPEQVEEEVEVPVRPRHEARRARVGRRIDLRPEQPLVRRVVSRSPGRPLPDHREPDDRADDDEAHDRVVEHRVRVEGLPARLDVGLVAGELRPCLVDAARLLLGDRGHYSRPPGSACIGEAPEGRGTGRVRPGRSRAPSSSSGSPPAASFDHGGEVTPSRTTR